MSETKWEYKIVDHSNSTSMGYSNPETEEFKEKHKDKDWKLEMMNIEINKLTREKKRYRIDAMVLKYIK